MRWHMIPPARTSSGSGERVFQHFRPECRACFCGTGTGTFPQELLPIVRSWTGWNLLSVNCSNRHDLPTPEKENTHLLSLIKYHENDLCIKTFFTFHRRWDRHHKDEFGSFHQPKWSAFKEIKTAWHVSIWVWWINTSSVQTNPVSWLEGQRGCRTDNCLTSAEDRKLSQRGQKTRMTWISAYDSRSVWLEIRKDLRVREASKKLDYMVPSRL